MDPEDVAIDALVKYSSRLTRACGYAVVAWLLLRSNLFGTPFTWSIPVALGILGIASSSARIAQLGLLLLLLMALIPLGSLIPPS